MNATAEESIVVTGLGMLTPLGNAPGVVWSRLNNGDSARHLSGFGDGVFACRHCATVQGFGARPYVSEPKLTRLMNRDAQFAVAAARLSLEDAGLKAHSPYSPEEIGLFVASGLAGLPMQEVTPLVLASTSADGKFDAECFGQNGLKTVSPILSFKLLSNMPLCFVSINENIQGVNAIYTPWEGQGAHAIEAGIRALRAGDARCALVGASDVKTHELAFATLEQQGVFTAWEQCGGGFPGEGAAFVVLETESIARERHARIYARIGDFRIRSHCAGESLLATRTKVLAGLGLPNRPAAMLSSATSERAQADQQVLADAGLSPIAPEFGRQHVLPNRALSPSPPREERAGERRLSALCHANSGPVGLSPEQTFAPKKQLGDLFAAAGVLQFALGAHLASSLGKEVVATCFGHGSEQAVFVLHPA